MLAAMVIILIATSAILFLFATTSSSGQLQLDKGQLDRQLQTIMDIITNDVQRAGYWSQASSSNSNPFMQTGTTDITINGASNCILFTYDHDNDGLLPAISAAYDDERYGYRLKNNVIQFRPYGASFDCTAASNNWSNLTNSALITITAFTVTLTNVAVDVDKAEAGVDTTNYRTVTITITGQLPTSTGVTKTITRTIRVVNNKYAP